MLERRSYKQRNGVNSEHFEKMFNRASIEIEDFSFSNLKVSRGLLDTILPQTLGYTPGYITNENKETLGELYSLFRLYEEISDKNKGVGISSRCAFDETELEDLTVSGVKEKILSFVNKETKDLTELQTMVLTTPELSDTFKALGFYRETIPSLHDIELQAALNVRIRKLQNITGSKSKDLTELDKALDSYRNMVLKDLGYSEHYINLLQDSDEILAILYIKHTVDYLDTGVIHNYLTLNFTHEKHILNKEYFINEAVTFAKKVFNNDHRNFFMIPGFLSMGNGNTLESKGIHKEYFHRLSVVKFPLREEFFTLDFGMEYVEKYDIINNWENLKEIREVLGLTRRDLEKLTLGEIKGLNVKLQELTCIF